MKKIVAITAPDADNGFACCGAVQYAAPPGHLDDVLNQVLADPETGVLILDERLMAEAGEDRLRAIEQRWPGVLVVLPAPERGAVEEDYAARLIRRAVGYHVRVRL